MCRLGIGLIAVVVALGACGQPTKKKPPAKPAKLRPEARPSLVGPRVHARFRRRAAARIWSCAMHPRVQKKAAGKCPICGMDLHQLPRETGPQIAVRKGFVWSCSMHPQVVKAVSGKCPICGMDLVKHSRAPTPKPPSLPVGIAPAPHPAKRLSSTATFRQLIDIVYLSYLRAQVALSADRLVDVKKAGLRLVLMVGGVKSKNEPRAVRSAWTPLSRSLRGLGKKLSTARRLADARRTFAAISVLLIQAVQAFGLSGSFPAYRFHCPMASKGRGADWLQRTVRVRNPYFGATMLGCGTRRAIR